MGEERNVGGKVRGELPGTINVADAHQREESKLEVGEEGEEGLTGATAVTVNLHQFISHEICSVRFGPQQDALATIIVPSLFLLGLHGAIWAYCRAEEERASRWRLYLESNQFLVGTLLYFWIIGFNIVSWVIYRQFERNEPYPADDYYLAGLSEAGRVAQLTPLILNLPDKRLALAQQ